jgi:squalene-hopene/tetraprenyl-beta-curcumene cyclase
LIGDDPDASHMRRAAEWLKSIQHEDGGWGESNDSHLDPARCCNHVMAC